VPVSRRVATRGRARCVDDKRKFVCARANATAELSRYSARCLICSACAPPKPPSVCARSDAPSVWLRASVVKPLPLTPTEWGGIRVCTSCAAANDSCKGYDTFRYEGVSAQLLEVQSVFPRVIIACAREICHATFACTRSCTKRIMMILQAITRSPADALMCRRMCARAQIHVHVHVRLCNLVCSL
jgi:hypothetical protein